MSKIDMEANNQIVRYGALQQGLEAIKSAYMMNEDKRALMDSVQAEMSQINVILRAKGEALRSKA